MDSTLLDVELAARVCAGDVAAFGDLFQRHRDAMQRHARRLTRCSADADALISDTFTAVLATLRRREAAPEFVRAYLLAAMRKIHAGNLRRSAARPLVLLGDDHDLPDHVDLASDPAVIVDERPDAARSAAVWHAVHRMRPRYRAVFWLTEVDGRNRREVGHMLGVTPGNAAQIATRARQEFREIFAGLMTDQVGP